MNAGIFTSIQEYLSDAGYERSEYVDGQVVPLNVGSFTHSRVQVKCVRKVDEFLDACPAGYALVGLHCLLISHGKFQFRVPDVAVVLDGNPERLSHIEKLRYLDRAPDLAVEIRSPDDSLDSLHRRMSEYLANGAQIGWLLLPEEQTAQVFTPGAAPHVLTLGEFLDGGDLLPGLRIRIDDLFVESRGAWAKRASDG